MDNAPTEAAAPAPAGETVATPTNTDTEPTKAPGTNSVDLHGFTQEDLAGMRTFIDNNGGWDKIKSRISNPEKAVEKPVENSQPEPQRQEEPTSHIQTAPETFKTPKGAITAQEFLAEQYFRSLAGEEKYANIADGVRNGDYLKEMSAFGIQPLNPDGSINDQKVRMYLDLKSQTVPAKPTETEPNASAAPTVTYTEVGENGIKDLNQAYKIIMEKGNPNINLAEKFIKENFNSKS